MNEDASALSPLFDRLADGICLTSRGRILYLNPAAQKLLGVALDEVRGSSLCDLLCGHLSTTDCGNCASLCALRDPARAEQAVTFDGRYRRRAFDWHELKIDRIENARDLRVRCLRTAPWPDAEQADAHLVILEDVSARESLEKEREDWRNMIAHDLRSPLTSIYGILMSMQEELAAGAAKAPDAEMLGIGVRNCRRMVELIDLYLDVSKLDSGLMGIEPAALDLAKIVRQCVEEQSLLARERRLALRVDVPDGLMVLADAQLLPRVVLNLLNNALKFTPEGGSVSLAAGGRGPVELRVEDTGPGIAPEEIPRLFDRYHQARARREGRIQGTGLGLAFCRQASAAMNGDIRVESTPGEGSRFILRLPAPPRRRTDHED
jgi:signal transduction histidine kinase